MKKLRNFVLLTIAMLMLLTGCATASDESNKDYDSIIIQNAETVTDDLGFDFDSNPFDGNRKFTVTKNSERRFSIDVDGTEMIVKIQPTKSYSERIPSDVCDASTKYSKLIFKSKKLICKYIDASSILNNKEELKGYINDLPVEEATVTNIDEGAAAYFSHTDECIYINKE